MIREEGGGEEEGRTTGRDLSLPILQCSNLASSSSGLSLFLQSNFSRIANSCAMAQSALDASTNLVFISGFAYKVTQLKSSGKVAYGYVN